MTIRLRLTLYWTAVTALILSAAGVLIIFLFARELWGTLDRALLEEADTSAAILAEAPAAETDAILRHLADERDLGPGRRVRLVVAGRTVFDQGDPSAELPAVGASVPAAMVTDGGGRRDRFALIPFRFNGQPALLADGVDASAVRHAIRTLRHTLMLVLGLIFALCVTGGYWLSVRALAPLGLIARALAQIGPRDLRQRLPLPRARNEAHKLIDEINDLLIRLEQAAAVQRQFVSAAAHELRTPLTVLRSGLEVALQRPRTAAQSRLALAEALAEAERICTIAEDLLTLARLDAEPGSAVERSRAPALQAVDLQAVVGEATQTARVLAQRKRQTLQLTAAVRPLLRGNPSDLRRMVLNLLGNAIKFTPEKGRIEVDLTQDAGSVIIAVRDNGPGIDEAELPRIFDPFFRSRRAFNPGSGLGLTLCREIVRTYHGEIYATNRREGGCEIRVQLPLPLSPEAPPNLNVC